MQLLGVAADRPDRLARMREENSIPFTMLSDPELTMAEHLEVPTSSGHPMAKKYPKGAFLQPAYFVMRPGAGGVETAYAWVQRPGLLNMYGASGRPRPRRMLSEARAALA